ncbi:hypothetical protein [Enterobacter hormaechei]|uniref:hypothetical protein n=1 Tax=Enterobacter hormaechei TaxID=158836 RepID=UPI0006493E57|nr:hypothetical protein [Enterobacter hormaechei]KLQ35465.1 hypothetical protein ABF72_01825 [Enterobacter hormaechei subsp. steigerwaltii]
MSNNNLTDARLSALIRVARDSLELYEMELPVIDDLMLALAELQQRRAAMLQGAENAESRCTIKTAPALDSLTKNAESRCGNSPVIQDGWVLVPEEPTHEMLEAGDEQFGTYDVYRRMIAASPQQK